MRFTVGVPATRADSLPATVRSILAQSESDWELVVIGQGDDSAVRAAAEAAFAGDRRCRYVRIPVPGSSLARNAVFREAAGELIAMTDDDCEADRSWLAVIGESFDADPKVGLVGGAVIAPPRRRRLGNCPSVMPADSVYDPVAAGREAPPGWDWISANFAVRPEVIERVGGFDECLGPGTELPAGEDVDFKLRLEGAGTRMRTNPRAAVVHTFGWRYGFRALLRHQRNYAMGTGALAGKLTLAGDARGAQWLADTRRQCTRKWLVTGRPYRLAPDLRRLYYFSVAYDLCTRSYRIDGGGNLARVGSGAAAPATESVKSRA